MNQTKSDEYSKVMLFVTEMRRKLNRTMDDQIFMIEQQRDRIDYQQQQINDIRVIIEELAWQIRDLRDSVRRCNETVSSSSQQCSDHSETENLSEINIPTAIESNLRQSNHVSGRKMFSFSNSTFHQCLDFNFSFTFHFIYLMFKT